MPPRRSCRRSWLTSPGRRSPADPPPPRRAALPRDETELFRTQASLASRQGQGERHEVHNGTEQLRTNDTGLPQPADLPLSSRYAYQRDEGVARRRAGRRGSREVTGRPPEADRVASVVVPCREWTWQVPGTGSDPGTPSPLEPPGPPRAPHTPAAAAPRRAGTGHPITWPVHSLCPPSTVQLTPSQRGLVASYGPHGQHMLDRVQAG